MPLHSISEDSTVLEHHCDNPKCQYHNCANWEGHRTCKRHDSTEYVMIPAEVIRERMAGIMSPDALASLGDTFVTQPSTKGRRVGETRQVAIDHPGIEWTAPGVVAMPHCDGIQTDGKPCTARLFLKVEFDEDEMANQNITVAVQHPQDPSIIQRIDQHPAVARHKQLAAKLTEMGRVYTPPELQPLNAQPAPMDLQRAIELLKTHGVKVVSIDQPSIPAN